MLTYKVMSRNGDDQTVFDTTDAKAIDAAMARFQELVGGQKFLAYIPGKDGAPGTQVRQFGDINDAQEVVFTPPLIGG